MPFNENELERQEINNMIREIYHVVLGSEHDKQSGLLLRVRSLEMGFEKMHTFLERSKWVLIGMALPASWGIVQLLVTLFQFK